MWTKLLATAARFLLPAAADAITNRPPKPPTAKVRKRRTRQEMFEAEMAILNSLDPSDTEAIEAQLERVQRYALPAKAKRS
jgi:hypothetical protein